MDHRSLNHRRRAWAVGLVLLLIAAVVATSSTAASADPLEDLADQLGFELTPDTGIRRAQKEDVSYLTGPPFPNDYLWWALQDPDGCAKVMGAIKSTNIPPSVGWNIYKPNGDGTCTYSNQVDLLAAPLVHSPQPKVYGASPTTVFEFAWHEEQQNWTLDYSGADIEIHVIFENPQPGGAFLTIWDGQPVYWSSSIGRADVRGFIKFPGQTREEAVEISGWYGEEERMAGFFEVTPGHRGYEYAQGMRKDGSAEQLFTFPNHDGTTRGALIHTGKDFEEFSMCTPTTPTELSDYETHPNTGFRYPTKMSASCTGPMGSVSQTWTTITSRFFLIPSLSGPENDDTDNNYHVGPVPFPNFEDADGPIFFGQVNDACMDPVCQPSSPSRANMQHMRNIGFQTDDDGD